MNFADSAKHFGTNNLIMLKSPISGLSIIELLSGSQVKHVHAEAKDSYLIDDESQNDFHAIQTIECK